MAKVFLLEFLSCHVNIVEEVVGSEHSQEAVGRAAEFQLRLSGEVWVFNIVYMCLHDKMFWEKY